MTVIVFPGQGSQYVGMTKDFYDNFKSVRDIFDLISDTTNIKIKEIIFEDNSNLLDQTQFTQLSLFCSSISIYQALINEIGIDKLNVNYMLGHSLGEYTALTAANILSIKDCALLLKTRGELMQNAYEPNKSSMAALIGINCNTALNIIKSNDLKIEIANDNSPLQVVISGLSSEIKESEKIFKENGVTRFVLLNVSAAFHSFLMNDAQDKMKKYIQNTDFQTSTNRIISNYTGKVCKDSSEIIYNLSQQMSNRVRWVESIITLENLRVPKIIEIGPGKLLSGLIKRISSNFNITNITNIDDIKNLL